MLNWIIRMEKKETPFFLKLKGASHELYVNVMRSFVFPSRHVTQ